MEALSPEHAGVAAGPQVSMHPLPLSLSSVCQSVRGCRETLHRRLCLNSVPPGTSAIDAACRTEIKKCVSVCPSFCLSVCLSVSLSVCMAVYLFVCLSVCVCVYVCACVQCVLGFSTQWWTTGEETFASRGYREAPGNNAGLSVCQSGWLAQSPVGDTARPPEPCMIVSV